jgi:hypothetical protein
VTKQRGSFWAWATQSAGLIMILALALFAPVATASSGHLFDARLSLRGDCAVSSLDEVPDPGVCPGTTGVDHPPKAFEQPCGTALDRYGDLYVASGAQGGAGTEGRIDVFNAEGEYLTEIKDERQPCGVAVDSLGNVYVAEYVGKNTVRFEPKSFPPVKGSDYEPGVIVHEPDHTNGSSEICTGSWSVAVDPSNDHLFVGMGCSIIEYRSAAEGNAVAREGIGVGSGSVDLLMVGIYGANHDVYTTASGAGGAGRVFVLDGGDGHKKCEIDGSETPEGSFGFKVGFAGLAVDQENGDVYVADIGEFGREAVDQFDSSCHYIGQIKHSFKEIPIVIGGGALAVDSPCVNALEEGCDLGAYESPNAGNVYVAQGKNNASYHVYAFQPAIPPVRPEVADQSASSITDAEAVLEGRIDPGNAPATYWFEYTTQAQFEASGYAGASRAPVPNGSLEAGTAFVGVAVPVSGLLPETQYRFRLVASNHCDLGEPEKECVQAGEGSEGKDAAFATYPSEAGLPDGRAYELVTPVDTNGRIPTVSELGSGFNASSFNTSLVSPSGASLSFGTEGGAIPGLGGGGYHDTYRAVRVPGSGWQSQFTGLSAAQAQEPHPGGIEANQELSFWQAEGASGSLAVGGQTGANYIRRPGGVLSPKCSPEPGGSFEFVGCGKLGTEPFARGVWISPGGSHVVFTDDAHKTGVPAKRLESCSPPAGISAIYDRTPDGVTHCVSLLPGETTQTARSVYQGVSEDGSAVAFTVDGDPGFYVRLDDAQTVQAAEGQVRFGGLSRDGSRLVYLVPDVGQPTLPGTEIPQGEIFACDLRSGPCAGAEKSQDPIQIGEEDSVLVNVSADGSHVYFVSPRQLDGSRGTLGADNLYLWDGSTHFIATLEHSDVVGHAGIPGGANVGGLGLWVSQAVAAEPGIQSGAASDPSRSSPDGSVLVFESRAQLGEYANGGHSEVYRYEAGAAVGSALACASCNPTGAVAESNAQLQSDYGAPFATFPPVTSLTPVANLSADGRRVFFQSADQLALADTDGKVDVYEWEAAGSGSCLRAAGCISLISDGRSAANEYLYAATPSGGDVFFESAGLLVPEDDETTPSIYDAREGGGFPAPPVAPGECSGEACQQPQPSPVNAIAGSAHFTGPGNRRAGKCKSGKSSGRASRAGARAGAKKGCGGRRKPKHHRKARSGGGAR